MNYLKNNVHILNICPFGYYFLLKIVEKGTLCNLNKCMISLEFKMELMHRDLKDKTKDDKMMYTPFYNRHNDPL